MLSLKYIVMLLMTFIIIVSVNALNKPKILCDIRDTINITGGFLDQDGRFHHDGLIYEKEMFAEVDFINKGFQKEVQVEPHFRGCICEFKKCIRVCRFCDENEDANGKCVKTPTLMVPIDAQNNMIELPLKGKDLNYTVLEGKRCDTNGTYSLDPSGDPDDPDRWIFNEDKTEIMLLDKQHDGRYIPNKPHHFCFTQRKIDNETYETKVLECVPVEKKRNPKHRINRIGMLISLPFLIATFLVYGIIPELRNLHGKCLMAYVFSLMIFYIGSIIAHFLRSKLYKNDIRCVMLGYSYLIGVLLCFFWLNVMCYDIWNTFYYRRGRRRSEKSKFINYCLYAVGIPLLLILIVYFIDSTEFVSKKFRPEIGEDRCLVKKSVHAIYIYYPITILLLINIVLYSITAFTIYRVQKETAIIRQGDSQTHSKMKSDRNQFKLFLRLFVLMGVTWIMEVISFYLGKDLQALFYITDFLNCIQGVIIFFMFVWKPTVKKLIFQYFSSYFPTHSAESQSTNT